MSEVCTHCRCSQDGARRYDHHLEDNPPVFFKQYDEHKRKVTIAYQYFDGDYISPKGRKNMRFAASIFRPDDGDFSTFNEADHQKTALARLRTRPLWAEFGIASFLRRQIHERGVRSESHRQKGKRIYSSRTFGAFIDECL